MAINVAFSTQDGIISALIRWVTRSKVSHCVITFHDDTLDKVLVMEAVERGFSVTPWRRWVQDNNLVARYELPGSSYPVGAQAQALHELAAYLGTEYDTVSLFGFLWRRWRKRMRNPFSSGAKLICSEAVAIFLKTTGLPIDDPATYTPDDLWKLLQNPAYALPVSDT